MMFPRGAQRNHVLWQGVQTEAVVAEGNEISLFADEVRRSVLVDETHGNHVVALLQQSLGDVVASRGILIAGAAYLHSVDIGDVSIEECSQEQAGGLSGMCLVDVYMLSEPDASYD